MGLAYCKQGRARRYFSKLLKKETMDKITQEAERIFGTNQGKDSENQCSMVGYDGFVFGADFQKNISDLEIAALRAENAKLREALQTLYDEQNGCPLATRQRQWESAMKASQSALFETTPDPLYLAAPEMLEFLEDLAYPRRGTEAETWAVEARVGKMAGAIVAKAKGETA